MQVSANAGPGALILLPGIKPLNRDLDATGGGTILPHPTLSRWERESGLPAVSKLWRRLSGHFSCHQDAATAVPSPGGRGSG
jgi:hypothetical protein